MSDPQSNYTNQQKLIAALRDPRRYPQAVKTVQVIETHISWVLLAGRYAYKIKKALDLGFLDYSGLEARRFCCDEEIRLNRRTAPDIYLDVVAIGGSPDDPRVRRATGDRIRGQDASLRVRQLDGSPAAARQGDSATHRSSGCHHRPFPRQPARSRCRLGVRHCGIDPRGGAAEFRAAVLVSDRRCRQG